MVIYEEGFPSFLGKTWVIISGLSYISIQASLLFCVEKYFSFLPFAFHNPFHAQMTPD